MKKLFTLFMALLATTHLWAHDFEVDGIYYNYLDDNNVAVTYKGSSYDAYNNEYYGEVTIPETVTYNGTTYSVTSIGDWAFQGCSSLTSITIPNSVTSIGNHAFLGCDKLTTPVYNTHCFAYMPPLHIGAYTIPDGIKQIAGGAFFGCRSFTSITIPNSVTSIGDGALASCPSLTTIVVEVGNQVYDSRDNCNAIIETATNTLIAGCKNTIILNTVTSIGDRAFAGCSSLASVTIPNSVTNIGDYAFLSCDKLTSITIPNSVTSIGVGAFAWCSLTSLTIPNSVTSIGEYAFFYCSSLTSITIPNSVASIGDDAFEGCNKLTSPIYDARHFIHMPRSYKGAYVIPDGIQQVAEAAFYWCSKLTSVTIPNSVTCIGERAFSWCSKLTSLSIGSSVTNIGEEAFYKCSKLTSITCEATTPPVVGTDAFHKLSRKMPVIVPDESVDAYKSAPVWQDFNIQGKSTYIADKGKTKNHRR